MHHFCSYSGGPCSWIAAVEERCPRWLSLAQLIGSGYLAILKAGLPSLSSSLSSFHPLVVLNINSNHASITLRFLFFLTEVITSLGNVYPHFLLHSLLDICFFLHLITLSLGILSSAFTTLLLVLISNPIYCTYHLVKKVRRPVLWSPRHNLKTLTLPVEHHHHIPSCQSPAVCSILTWILPLLNLYRSRMRTPAGFRP